MQLPSELRNMIYKHCLEDPSGINLVAAFRHKRRTVERVSEEAQASIGGRNHYYTASRINDEVRAKYEEPVTLVPALLAVSKQIYQEGRNILYSNEFIFADTFALYSFLINLGPAGAKYLKHLRLMDWGFGRATKAYNHSCFAVLVWATNLETLRLDKTSGYARKPRNAADQLYRDAFPWLEAIGAAKGKMDAGVDVLQIDAEAFDYTYWHQNSQRVVSGEEKRDQFFGALTRLLGAQQKRIMVSGVKKRKTAKEATKNEV
jgi:hypothetical protein